MTPNPIAPQKLSTEIPKRSAWKTEMCTPRRSVPSGHDAAARRAVERVVCATSAHVHAEHIGPRWRNAAPAVRAKTSTPPDQRPTKIDSSAEKSREPRRTL